MTDIQAPEIDHKLVHMQRMVKAKCGADELTPASYALAFERMLRLRDAHMTATFLTYGKDYPELLALITPHGVRDALKMAMETRWFGEAEDTFAAVLNDHRLNAQINAYDLWALYAHMVAHDDIMAVHYADELLEAMLTDPKRWIAPALTPERVLHGYEQALATNDLSTAMGIANAMASSEIFKDHVPVYALTTIEAQEGDSFYPEPTRVLYDLKRSEAYVSRAKCYAKTPSVMFKDTADYKVHEDEGMREMGQQETAYNERVAVHFTEVAALKDIPDWQRDIALKAIPQLRVG